MTECPLAFPRPSCRKSRSFAPLARSIRTCSSITPGSSTAKPPFNADRVWNDLANVTSAAAGFAAVRELCGSPKEAIALLKEKLKPETIDPKAIDGWINDLSAAQFAVRERATNELEKQGENVVPQLRKALETTKEEETRQRITAILKRLETPSSVRLQLHRAMDALEHLGTPEAQGHLETLGRGSPTCLRTVQAQEALARISGR